MLYPRETCDGLLVEEAQMVNYGEHLAMEHRIVRLSGAITGEFAFHDFLMALDSLSHEPIKILITSPGGDLDSAFLLCDTLKIIKSPIITIGRYCASAACLILASGNERYLYPHAKTMLHLPAGQMGGDARDWEIQHRQMTIYKNKIIDILIEAGVKKKREEILIDIDRDFWMDSQETIDYGLADKILTGEKWLEFIGGHNASRSIT